MMLEIEIYETKDGKIPFESWLTEMTDLLARQKIRVRLHRLSLGNAGDCESVGDKVHELRIDYGPGYRVYFAKVDQRKILILWAGTKRFQQRDIDRAKSYLIDYVERGKHGEK